MFTQIRARLQVQLDALGQQQPTSPAVVADQSAVAAARDALAVAQHTTADRQSTANNAHNALGAAQDAVSAKAGALSHAQQALADLTDQEPFDEGPRGHTNPQHVKWVTEMGKLGKAVAAAKAALDQANNALPAAQAADGQATAALQVAAGAAQTAQQNLDAANRQLAADLAAAGSGQDQQSTALQDQLAGLDAEQARIEAQPGDPADLAAAADVQTSEVQRARHDRQALWAHRVANRQARAVLFAAHDASIDQLSMLPAAQTMNASHGLPGLGGFVADLGQALSTNAAQRGQPAEQRGADLGVVAAALARAESDLGAALSAASSEVAVATRALDAANTLVDDAKNEWT